MEEICLTNARLSKFEQIVKFVREGKEKHCVTGDNRYLLVTDCSQPPTKTKGVRFVFVGVESLRKGQERFFHCNCCFYSLRNGPGSKCVKNVGSSTLETVFCGRIGHELVFYVEKK